MVVVVVVLVLLRACGWVKKEEGVMFNMWKIRRAVQSGQDHTHQ